MTDREANALGKRMAVLAEVLEVPMTPTKIAGYRALLDDLAFEDIVAALNVLGKTSVFFPKPAEIREQAKQARQLRQSAERASWLKIHDADRPEVLREHDAGHVQALLESPNPPKPFDERLGTTRTIIAKLHDMVRPKAQVPEPDDHEMVVRRQIKEWKQEHQQGPSE